MFLGKVFFVVASDPNQQSIDQGKLRRHQNGIRRTYLEG